MIWASSEWGRVKPGDETAGGPHGALGRTRAMMGSKVGTHRPSCPLTGSNQPAHRPTASHPGGTFPRPAFPGLASPREPSHTTPPSKHPSTFRFMSRETGVRRKEWWSLGKASQGYGHGVVLFACGVAHHIAMASPALWPFSSLLIRQREVSSTADVSLYLWENVTG